MSLIPIPDQASISRVSSIGRILVEYGGILLTFLVVASFFGWVHSPLFEAVMENQRLLKGHEERERQLDERRKASVEQLERLIRLIKLIDCGEIREPELRNRCLNQ